MAFRIQDADATLVLSRSRLQAATAWCRAEIVVSISDEELRSLAQGLRDLAAAGHGSFLWRNHGGEIRLEVVMAKREETHFSATLQSSPDFLHELRLVFVGRQEELAELAEDVLGD